MLRTRLRTVEQITAMQWELAEILGVKPDYGWDTMNSKSVRTFGGKGEPECVRAMKFIGNAAEDVLIEIEQPQRHGDLEVDVTVGSKRK